MNQTSSTESIPLPMSRMSRLLINAFTIAALVMSAVLMWHEGQEHSALPGCASDSSCESVTGGRWALLAGIPVAGIGLSGYAALMSLSLLTHVKRLARYRLGLWTGMSSASLIGLGFIAWLIFLQWVVIGHFCIWCLTTHVFGALAFLCVLSCVPVWNAFPRARLRIGGASAGTLSLMIAAHVLIIPDITVAEEATDFNAAGTETGGSGGIQFGKKRTSRNVEFMGGNLSLDIYTLPVIGLRDAEHVIIELFDYTCPSCRKVSGKLTEFAALFPGKLAVVTMPVPMEAECNPHVKRTIPQFKDACQYTRIGMAVYQADRDQFPAFHEWLMDGTKIPSPSAARAQAISLIGNDAFEDASQAEEIDGWIRDGINLYQYIQGETLPKIIAGDQIISSSGLASRKLFKALRDALGLPEK